MAHFPKKRRLRYSFMSFIVLIWNIIQEMEWKEGIEVAHGEFHVNSFLSYYIHSTLSRVTSTNHRPLVSFHKKYKQNDRESNFKVLCNT